MTAFATQTSIQMTAPGIIGRAASGAGKSKLLTSSELRGLLGTGSAGLGAKYLADDSTWKSIDLSGYVPYTGATAALNLGSYGLTCGAITASGNADIGSASDASDSGGVLTVRRWRNPFVHIDANTAQGGMWGLCLRVAGNERAGLKIDINSGEVRLNVGSGGYYPTIYSNGVQRMIINTAGDTTFAGAITASGNVGIGGTPYASSSLHIQSSFARAILLNNSTIGTGATDGAYFGCTTTGQFTIYNQESASPAYTYIGQAGVLPIYFATNDVTRLTIAGDGTITASGAVTVSSGATGTSMSLDSTAAGGTYLQFKSSGVSQCYFGYQSGVGFSVLNAAASEAVASMTATILNVGNATRIGWSSSSSANNSTDTNISRASAGVVQIGTTANNAAGSLLLTNLTASGIVATSSYVTAPAGYYNYGSGGDALGYDFNVSTALKKHVLVGQLGASFVCFGGVTSSFPAIKRSGTTTAFRLADDSADGPISCGAITASGNLNIGANSLVGAYSGIYNEGKWLTGSDGYGSFYISPSNAAFMFSPPAAGGGLMASIDYVGGVNVITGFAIGSHDPSNTTVRYYRNATGPKASIRADGGLEVKDLSGSVDGPISCGAITASGTVRAGAFYEPTGQTTGWYMFSNGMYGYVSGGQMMTLNGAGMGVTGTLTASGSVGIGTSSPVSILELSSGIPVITLTGTGGARGIAYRNGTTEFASTKATFITGEVAHVAGYAGYGGYHTFSTNGVERLRLASNGTIGIGTTAPVKKLSIDVANATTDGIKIGYAGTLGEGLELQYLNSGSSSCYIDSRYNGDAAAMYFRMKTHGTPVNALTILGTGAATFGSSLTVNGALNCGAITASGTVTIDDGSSEGILNLTGTTGRTGYIKHNGSNIFQFTAYSGDVTSYKGIYIASAEGLRTAGNLTLSDVNVITGTTTGTIFATSASQKQAWWGATPIVQPTTSVAAATLVSNGGTALTDTDTFDGYTLKQIVKALRIAGLLA